VEHFDFLPTPDSRITNALARTLVELRNDVTLSALSRHFGVDPRVIKACEKSYLARKYAHIRLKDVKSIGIDEIYIGKTRERKYRFLTIVRDLDTGAVLFVGEGKGVEALEPFSKSLGRAHADIEFVAMDLGRPFWKWAEENLQGACIVHDHFHVMKLMNDKLNAVRRRTAATLDEGQRKVVKGMRFTLMRNTEELTALEHEHLAEVFRLSKDLASMHVMKEELRSIYRTCPTEEDARRQLVSWAVNAADLDIPELADMALSVISHLQGIAAYWLGGLSTASMEGFNNKIRALTRQAYGFRDMEYFRLKIFDLPQARVQDYDEYILPGQRKRLSQVRKLISNA
jgi:transposase